jgi:thioredoxin reductase (NADPH)
MNAAVKPLPQRAGFDERMFPSFTAAQLVRLAAHGRRRPLRQGDCLYEVGQPSPSFFVIVSGYVEIVRPSANGCERVAVHGPGQFTGEANLLAGGRALNRARVAEPGEAIEIDSERLLALVQTDAEIGEILMRSFILRRAYLISRGFGDAVVIGSGHSAGTLRIKEFLTRNAHPFTYLDLEHETGVQAVLDRFHVTERDVPVVVCRGEVVLRNPSNDAIAEALGLNPALDAARVHDLVVVGAGPAGLAAAVYAASEGLEVLVLEERAPGGQAGSSSKIENYLGFPTGISGQALAGRALAQVQKFGARVLIAKSATRLADARDPYRIAIGADACVRARAIVVATGAAYRKPALPNLTRFEGVGVYYAATFMEGQLCVDEEVAVIGGGNSAGQAAVFLAQTCRHVHILVRSRGLAETMSRYLIRRIEEHPGITVHAHTELVALDGGAHLERVSWRNNVSGAVETREVEHLFVMAGAIPATRWLDGCVALDAKGFVKTGADLTPEDLARSRWAPARQPYALETSLPGVFAVGDVRAGNVKRVASAVGEGSIAVSFVHRVLEA